jgi:hypothetical protein
MRRSALVLLLLVSAAGLAADDAPVGAPQVAVGDCWSYRARNIENRGPIGDYEECITFVDRNKKVILAVVTVKADGREIETSYTTEWSGRTGISGVIATPIGDQPDRFPLKVGDSYTETFEFRRALLGAVAGRNSTRYKVVGWEEVSVPAGKFRALKIEGNGTTERSDIGRSVPTKTDYWYVPEVNRHVKFRFQSPALDYGAELTGYRPKK